MKGTAALAGASLPDDVVREILMRVDDVADLFRCTMTCKHWRRLILKASFLRRSRWPEHETASFLPGFLLWEKIVIKDDPTFVTRFVPTPGSVFGSDRRSLESFFPRAATSGTGGRKRGLLHNAVPLVTRHGLLLVRLDTPIGKGCVVSSVHLAVCNLLSGACDKLPLLDCDWDFDKSGYAILTSADCTRNGEQQPSVPSGYSSFFKVLVIGTDMHYRPRNLHTFTSGKLRWSWPSKLISPVEERSSYCLPLRHPRAVVWRGTANWLVHYFTRQYPSLHTIHVDAGTCRASLTKIDTPVEQIEDSHYKSHNYDQPQLTLLTVDVDGQLSLLHVQKQGSQLDRWTRQEDGGPTRWLRTQVIELKPPRKTMMCLTLLEEKGGMLLIKDNHGNVYTADSETGAMKKFTDFNNIYRQNVVPLEMDWPTFFLSRLGALEPCLKKPFS